MPSCDMITATAWARANNIEMVLPYEKHRYFNFVGTRKQKHDMMNKLNYPVIKEYPKCKCALQWWCNEKGEKSSFNINRNKLLKEFIHN